MICPQVIRDYHFLYEYLVLISAQRSIGQIITVKIYRIAAARGEDKSGTKESQEFFIMVICERKGLAILAPPRIIFFKSRIVCKGLMGACLSRACKEA